MIVTWTQVFKIMHLFYQVIVDQFDVNAKFTAVAPPFKTVA